MGRTTHYTTRVLAQYSVLQLEATHQCQSHHKIKTYCHENKIPNIKNTPEKNGYFPTCRVIKENGNKFRLKGKKHLNFRK